MALKVPEIASQDSIKAPAGFYTCQDEQVVFQQYLRLIFGLQFRQNVSYVGIGHIVLLQTPVVCAKGK